MANVLPQTVGEFLFSNVLSITGLTGPAAGTVGNYWVALCTTALAPTATMIYFSEVTAQEVWNTGDYVASGWELTGTYEPTTTRTGAVTTFDSPDLTWTNVTLTGVDEVQYAILIQNSGDEFTSPIMGIYDFGGTEVNNGTLTLNVSNTGWIDIQ